MFFKSLTLCLMEVQPHLLALHLPAECTCGISSYYLYLHRERYVWTFASTELHSLTTPLLGTVSVINWAIQRWRGKKFYNIFLKICNKQQQQTVKKYNKKKGFSPLVFSYLDHHDCETWTLGFDCLILINPLIIYCERWNHSVCVCMGCLALHGNIWSAVKLTGVSASAD